MSWIGAAAHIHSGYWYSSHMGASGPNGYLIAYRHRRCDECGEYKHVLESFYNISREDAAKKLKEFEDYRNHRVAA